MALLLMLVLVLGLAWWRAVLAILGVAMLVIMVFGCVYIAEILHSMPT